MAKKDDRPAFLEGKGFLVEIQDALRYFGFKRGRLYQLLRKHLLEKVLRHGRKYFYSEHLWALKKKVYGDHDLDFAVIGKRRDGSSVAEGP